MMRNRLRCAHRFGFINDAHKRITSRVRTNRAGGNRKFRLVLHRVGSASRSNKCTPENEYDARDRETNNQCQNDFHQKGPHPRFRTNLDNRTSKTERPQEKPAQREPAWPPHPCESPAVAAPTTWKERTGTREHRPGRFYKTQFNGFDGLQTYISFEEFGVPANSSWSLSYVERLGKRRIEPYDR
jgi:hypothetical protein